MERINKIFIGIDPGASGAAAILSPSNKLGIYDYDTPAGAARFLREWSNDIFIDVGLVVLERVSAMPKQGVSSMFKFGTNYGIWHGILAAFELPHILVTPQTWRKGLVTKSDGKNTKEQARTVASRLFPKYADQFKLVKNSDRAEAALMALHARNTYYMTGGT